jgi:hypothetical protein
MKKLALLMLALVICSVNAQPIQNVYVFTESADEDFNKCNLSNEGLLASARATLRYNRITTAEVGNSDVALYINASVMPSVSGYCSSYLSIEIYKHAAINIQRGKIWGSHVLCKKGGLSTYTIQNTQFRLNELVRSMTERCITEIEDKLNK